MNDIKFIKGDDEADAMLLCAVQWVMHDEIKKVIEKFARLVPPSKGDQFVDYLFETKFIPDRCVTDNEAGSPDLCGDKAYRNYVCEVMGVTK